MPRIMRDSISAGQIDPATAVVAGYGPDNTYVWSAADWARFPNSTRILIASHGSSNWGDMLDVERTLATPADAPGWIRLRQASGYAVPTIYCNRSTRPTVAAACAGLVYDLCISTLDGTQVTDVALCQYLGAPPGGPNVDTSIIYDDRWPRRSLAPRPPTGDTMLGIVAYDIISGGTWAVNESGAVYTDTENLAPYLGGLNQHPDWHAGLADTPAVGIAPWRTGYVIVTHDAHDTTGDPFRYYRFASNRAPLAGTPGPAGPTGATGPQGSPGPGGPPGTGSADVEAIRAAINAAGSALKV